MADHRAAALSVELVPATVWGDNLRNRLTVAQWNKCKKFAKSQSGGVRAACGKVGAKGRVDCHEQWEWIETEESHIQRLVGLVSLCPRCHSAKHYGRAQKIGYGDDADEQLRVVNGWSADQLGAHLRSAIAEWKERSEHHWELDLSWLPKNLGITPGPARPSQYTKTLGTESVAESLIARDPDRTDQIVDMQPSDFKNIRELDERIKTLEKQLQPSYRDRELRSVRAGAVDLAKAVEDADAAKRLRALPLERFALLAFHTDFLYELEAAAGPKVREYLDWIEAADLG